MSIARLMQMAAAGVPKGEPWLADLANASYDSVSFSTASQETSPSGLTFKPDGTKMYVVGFSSDSVHQYSLSTAFDLSTASYDSVSFSVASQDTSPYKVKFNNDGTKIYMVGISTDTVYQYSLSTAYDLSTASYDSVSFSVSGQDLTPLGLSFKPDGTKMYVVGSTNDSIFQYSLSTEFDLSTASYDSVSFSVASQETSPHDAAFSPSGVNMYIIGSSGDDVNEFLLSTAWDVSTATYVQNFSVSGQDLSPTGLAFNLDGSKMYITGNQNNSVFQYTTA